MTKDFVVPPSLMDLPAPWNRIGISPRTETELTDTPDMRRSAVVAIDLYLRGLTELPPEAFDDDFPEDMTNFEGLHNAALIREMPRFEDFRLEPIEDSFGRLNPRPSTGLVRRYGLSLLGGYARFLAGAAESWLFESLRDNPDAAIFEGLRAVAERHWRAHPDFVESLISSLASHDHANTLPLIRRVASNPEVSDKLYERLVGWLLLPDSLSLLPNPWGQLDLDSSAKLPNSAQARANALEALDRLLASVAELPALPLSSLPPFVSEAWSEWNREFERAQLKPLISHFDLDPIIFAFEKRVATRSEAIDLAFRYGQKRLRELTRTAAERVRSWLLEVLPSSSELGLKEPSVNPSFLYRSRQASPKTLSEGLRLVLEKQWAGASEFLEPLLARLLELEPSIAVAWLEDLERPNSPNDVADLATFVRTMLRR